MYFTHLCEFSNANYHLLNRHSLFHDYQGLGKLICHLQFNSVVCKPESQIAAPVLCLKAYAGLEDAKYKSNAEEAAK